MAPEGSVLTRRRLLTQAATLGVSALGSGAIGVVNAEAPPSLPADRYGDALSIRNRAALHGVRPVPTYVPEPGADTDLKISEYSKALDRDSSGRDPLLPKTDAFHALRMALDSAYGGDTAERANELLEKVGGVIGNANQPPDPKTQLRLTNPVGGLSFDLEGFDPPAAPMRRAPEYGKEETAAEAVETYWMALLRDIPFSDLDKPPYSSAVQSAVTDLAKLSFFQKNPELLAAFWRARIPAENLTSQMVFGKPITPQMTFPGVSDGPYVSQFLVRGTNLAENASATPADGIVAYGPQRVSQKIVVAANKTDYLFDLDTWRKVHGGDAAYIGKTQLQANPRFLTYVRDGASYVHFDEIYQEYLIAASILLSMVPQRGATLELAAARLPQLRLAAYAQTQKEKSSSCINLYCETKPHSGDAGSEQHNDQYIAEQGKSAGYLNCGNPYRYSASQNGFASFGVTHILTLLAETSTRAHKAGWYHKWMKRRLRPEEYGARLHALLSGTATSDYGLSKEILAQVSQSEALKQTYAANKTYLLPQAFSEGCPTHPAYPSGHATIAGASVTVLKALFNETMLLNVYQVADVTGQKLVLQGSELLTVGGELNKLGSNVLFFRGFAGVHWRSDSIEGALLGERVAIELLVEQTTTSARGVGFYRELIAPHSQNMVCPGGITPLPDPGRWQSPYFRFTTFKGVTIDIVDGRIFLVRPLPGADQECWHRTSTEYKYEDFVGTFYSEAFM